MKQVTSIYVPLDTGEASKAVISIASTLSETLGASLCFVHAMEHAEAAENLLEHLHLQSEQLHNAIIEPMEGLPGDVIEKTSRDHPRSIIVMPTHAEETTTLNAELGPISVQVLQRALCPIVFAPFGLRWDNWKPARLLMPQDSTAACAMAVAPAAELADRADASVTLLHVPSYSNDPFDPATASLPLPRYQDHQPQHALAAWKEEFVERLRELGQITRKTNVKLVLGMSDPSSEILMTARSIPADMIVMPWYGDFGRTSILRNVLQDARCPVMVLPIPKQEIAQKAA